MTDIFVEVSDGEDAAGDTVGSAFGLAIVVVEITWSANFGGTRPTGLIAGGV